jgi:hypothetical protein
MKISFLVLVSLLLMASGCNQNLEVAGGNERLEDAPKPAVDPNERPLALAVDESGEKGEKKVPPFAKAFFMHQWVEALYSVPKNKNPNPNWQSPLKDPVNGRVWCTDCHTSGQIDFEKIPKKRTPFNDDLEKDKEFMVGLMKKWVARLNSDEFHAKAKLKGPVTCLTCHATNPAESN